MKKLLKSKKALSPVVAAIILIAVTVAVSIAVAVWMGSLSFNFMATEQISITQVQFGTGSVSSTNNVMNVTVLNTGTTDVVFDSCTVTGSDTSGYVITIDNTPPVAVTAGDTLTVDIDLGSGSWTVGNLYTVELISTKGNTFAHTDTA